MSEPVAGAGAPDPAVAVNGGQVPQVDLPPGWMLVPAPPPLTPEQRAESAAVHRAEAHRDYEASLNAADETEAQGRALIESAGHMRAHAETVRAAGLAYADSLSPEEPGEAEQEEAE